MINYLSIDEAAKYLNVSTETIKRYMDNGQLPSYKLDRALRFKPEDLDNLMTYGIVLTPGIRAVASHIVPVREGADAWRVVLKFFDTSSANGGVIAFGDKVKITEYFVWVSAEYLEDFEHLTPDMHGAEIFALRWAKRRFDETADKDGIRSLNLINEASVLCQNGKCIKGGVYPTQ